MARQNTYGKRAKKSQAARLFAELPQSPLRKPQIEPASHDVEDLTSEFAKVHIDQTPQKLKSPLRNLDSKRFSDFNATLRSFVEEAKLNSPAPKRCLGAEVYTDLAEDSILSNHEELEGNEDSENITVHDYEESLRILTWDDVCPAEDRIEKIAEASSAEVYRITNDHGTSIIKVVRLDSPIKAQTKTQVLSKLIDEQPHPVGDLDGELQISQWLADIPGFVVYKERYIVQGKTTKKLLETHQKFQRKLKRQDPGRAQFYPSPSRYLDETKFLVVELGDAGTALEDWKSSTESQLWDIFFLVAIALARAEDLAMFEHRDLHEGNLCIRSISTERKRSIRSDGPYYGYSGLDITILDYGLSRAEDLEIDYAKPIFCDLEKDLSLFTSTHAHQCEVYRQMRSFLLRADRTCLPPEAHKTPYARGMNGTLSWDVYAPYTNVLWLAYLYKYLTNKFQGDDEDLAKFQEKTKELWMYLDSNAAEDTPCFGSAAEVVCFAVEAGWISEAQLASSGTSILQQDETSL